MPASCQANTSTEQACAASKAIVDAALDALRATTAISHPNRTADPFQRLLRRSERPRGARRSPHPAANRLVQEAFRIGVPLRKALSIATMIEILNRSGRRRVRLLEEPGDTGAGRYTRGGIAR